LVYFTYKMGVRHRGIDSGPTYGIEYPIGLGSRPMYRSAATEAALSPLSFIYYDNGLSAGQIMDYTHRKYTMGAVRVPMNVTANTWYEFSMSGGSHTNAGSRDGADGSAEINPDNINYLLVEYEAGKFLT
jgi:hypothetical protein